MNIFLGEFFFQSRFTFCFCYLLDTLSKYGYVKVATEVFNKEKFRVEANAKLYTVLICGWCKIGRTEMAWRFLREMLEKGIEPNVITYNAVLNGICRHAMLHPEFETVIREAHDVLNEMHERKLGPDVTSYSILLHVYTRAHKPHLCLDKLRMMKETGISPSVATYTFVVKCLCSRGRAEDAEELLCEMTRQKVYLCADTYNCFFKEYKGKKDFEGAMKLYRKMKEEDSLCSPNIHKLGKFGCAREIWDNMKVSGIGPGLDSHTLLVHGLCEKRKWQEACEYFMEMIEKGFLPQKVTFERLYRGLIQGDVLRTWRRLKKKIEEESVNFGLEFEEYQLKP